MNRAEKINPRILSWARESAGLSLDQAAARLGIKPGKEHTRAEKLALVEAGERAPTRTQLTKYAALYRRPLISFYLKAPPAIGERGQDFRTAPRAARSPRESALLDALLRDVRARQEMVVDVLETTDERAERKYVGSASLDDGQEKVLGLVAAVLQFNPADRSARKGGVEGFFRELRARAEAAGVFVLLIGDLGSHHSALSSDTFRGFAIADKIAPFVVINDQDAKSAWAFTLIHELVHILLGQTGISGEPDPETPKTPTARIERFCDDVAGEFLLPGTAVAKRPAFDPDNDKAAAAVIAGFAEQWCVSEPMVAYRFNRLGWISRRTYDVLNAEYVARWRAARQKAKDKAKESESGGPSYYAIRQHRLGDALIDVVRRSLRENALTHTKAAKVLGVKPTSVEPLLQRFERARGMNRADVQR